MATRSMHRGTEDDETHTEPGKPPTPVPGEPPTPVPGEPQPPDPPDPPTEPGPTPTPAPMPTHVDTMDWIDQQRAVPADPDEEHPPTG